MSDEAIIHYGLGVGRPALCGVVCGQRIPGGGYHRWAYEWHWQCGTGGMSPGRITCEACLAKKPRETPDEVVARHAADSKELASKPASNETMQPNGFVQLISGHETAAQTVMEQFYAACTGAFSLPGYAESAYERYRATVPLAAKPKCKPDCTPAQPCHTDNVCPVFREPIAGCAVDEAVHWASKLEDQREAREWRSQRYEPARNGLGGGFVGSWNGRAVR